jgi:murein hydrolase activator
VKKHTIAIVAFVFISLFWSPAFYQGVALASPPKITDTQEKLEQIKKRLKDSYKKLRSKESRERSLQKDLKFVEREIDRCKRRLATFEKEAQSGIKEIQRKKEQIRLIEAAIEKTEGQVQKRLSALYKGDEATLVKLFFSSESPSELMENYVFLERIVQRDKKVLTTYRSDYQHLNNNLESLKALQAKQQGVLDAAVEAKKEQEKVFRLKKKLLVQTATEKKRLSKKIRALKSRAEKLSSLVRKLEEEKVREYQGEKDEFSRRKGKLAWPVNGKIKVGFGTWRHPELGTLYESQGLDIEAPVNNPIAAVWNGKVAFASRFRGYGNLLIVNHGEGYYSLYGHASKLLKKVGEPVARGEIIAHSGFEGNDSVYFEIRRRGIPLDPTKWLLQK